jgi:hypothetical protein
VIFQPFGLFDGRTRVNISQRRFIFVNLKTAPLDVTPHNDTRPDKNRRLPQLIVVKK